jgi:hypothetical protein
LIRRAAQKLGTEAGPVSRLFLGPLAANSYFRMSSNKKGRILWNPPYPVMRLRS